MTVPEIRKIPKEHRHNMDEIGNMEGEGSSGLVLRYTNDNLVPPESPDSRAWASTLESTSAAGIALPPLVIFKRLTVRHQWFPKHLEEYEGRNFTASEKGWTSNDIASEWFLKIFIRLTRPEKPQKRLLIVDGHGIHETINFMYNCFIDDIRIL